METSRYQRHDWLDRAARLSLSPHLGTGAQAVPAAGPSVEDSSW